MLQGLLHFTELKPGRSEEHTSELQSHHDIVCRLLPEKKNRIRILDFEFQPSPPWTVGQWMKFMNARAYSIVTSGYPIRCPTPSTLEQCINSISTIFTT